MNKDDDVSLRSRIKFSRLVDFNRFECYFVWFSSGFLLRQRNWFGRLSKFSNENCTSSQVERFKI